MSRFYLNHNKENKLEAVYSSAEKDSVISGDYLTSFLNMVMKMKDITVNVNKADNMIVLEAGKDKIIIKDAKKFLELEKDSNFVKFLKEKVISTPKPKKKIKKEKSISYKGAKKLASFLLAAGIVVAGVQGIIYVNDKLNENDYVIEEVTPAPTSEPANIIIETPTPVVTASPVAPTVVTPQPTPTPDVTIDTREEVDREVLAYARNIGVDENLVIKLLNNNDQFTADRVGFYRNIIDFMSYIRSEGYKVNVYSSPSTAAVIGTAQNGRYIILPAKYAGINSIVQVNPGRDASAMDAYPQYLQYANVGVVQDYMIIGSANHTNDFDSNANNNMLMKMIDFMTKHSYNITNVGIAGYNDSASAALLNAGHVLANYPRMIVNVGLIDGYNIDDINSIIDRVNTNGDSRYVTEARGLINGNPQIVSIVPTVSGDGISVDRPVQALNDSLGLNERLGDVTIVGSRNTNRGEYINDALNGCMLNYLAGIMPKERLLDWCDSYYIPEYSYNADLGRFEYVNQTPQEVINDTITFG